jgi:hypothetical protein
MYAKYSMNIQKLSIYKNGTILTVLVMVIMIFVSQAVFAQEQTKDFSIIPMINYEYLRFDDQQLHLFGEGLLYTKGNMEPPVSEAYNNFMIGGMFKQISVNEVIPEYKGLYHEIIMMAERKINKHLFLGFFLSQAAEPVYGGLHTFVGALGYGYELIRNDNISLTLGAGLVVTDWDIEFSNDVVWPIFPMPLLRFSVRTSFVNFTFDFQKDITMGFTLLPESKIRLTGNSVINFSMLRSLRDMYFDITLWYRFFSKESEMGDFAGAGLGFKNHGLGASLDKGRSYELNYYSAYGILDMSFLKLSAGYSFNGREIYDMERINKIGNGFFVSAFLGWQF